MIKSPIYKEIIENFLDKWIIWQDYVSIIDLSVSILIKVILTLTIKSKFNFPWQSMGL